MRTTEGGKEGGGECLFVCYVVSGHVDETVFMAATR